MKTSHTILAIALAASVVGGAVAATPAPNRPAAPDAEWMTIPGIYDAVTAAGYRNIDEIERERDGYKVKAVDPSGERVKLFVDPVTGEILNARSKGGKWDRRNTDAPYGQQGGYDGNRNGEGRR